MKVWTDVEQRKSRRVMQERMLILVARKLAIWQSVQRATQSSWFRLSLFIRVCTQQTRRRRRLLDRSVTTVGLALPANRSQLQNPLDSKRRKCSPAYVYQWRLSTGELIKPQIIARRQMSAHQPLLRHFSNRTFITTSNWRGAFLGTRFNQTHTNS